MKRMKKIVSFMLAMIMVFAMSVTAFAAGTGSITITPPEGVNAGATNTYKIYKVFDAVGDGTNISYKLVDGKTTVPAGFTVDDAGNVTYSGTATENDEGIIELTEDDIAAIATYVEESDLVATVSATGSGNATAANLPNGYYYITTSTGSVVAIDSTNPNVTVTDKNTVPTLEKKITNASSYDTDGKKALAQVGSKVTFTATITVGKGATGYVFHDKMDDALKYNSDVAVTGIETSKYTVQNTPDAGDTITITFADGIAEGTTITITYSATVTSDAFTTDPANNTAYVSYGEENSNNKTPESITKVYNAKFTVTKQDGNNQPLAGAGFVIANEDGKYYKLSNGVVSWVDSIDDATEYTSVNTGAVPAFTGLANGTYTLIEKTVPTGYNKAADSEFTIAEHDYTATNLEQAATVTNKAGSMLPSTGGIGTTLFYIIGGILVIGGGVVLVTKKRMGKED